MTTVGGAPDPFWTERYRALARTIAGAAPGTGPHLLGFHACVDRVHRLDAAAFGRLLGQVDVAGPAGRLAAELVRRIRTGADGEVFFPWPDGDAWAERTFGPPAVVQLGGASLHAAWALGEVGAPTVLFLDDRGPDQLSVLPATATVVTGGRPAAPATAPDPAAPAPDPTAPDLTAPDPAGPDPTAPPEQARHAGKPAHRIVEFGPRFTDGPTPRAGRLILTLQPDRLERDAQLTEALPDLLSPGATLLVSGINDATTEDDLAWVEALLKGVRARPDHSGPATVHLELSDPRDPAALVHLLARLGPLTDSTGLSEFEIRRLAGPGESPDRTARRLAATHGLPCVVVHSDRWAGAVHRGDPRPVERQLLTGCLLAAGRARTGRPAARLDVGPDCSFVDPPWPAGTHDGWTHTAVPAPHVATPVSTIGLGDTFAAGLLLGSSLPET